MKPRRWPTDMGTILPLRLQREKETIDAMVRLYCRHHHGEGHKDLCKDCRELLAYAAKRLSHCPFQANKPTCGKCTVHCYKPLLRERIRRVMRFAGPRMIWHHPIMALRHLIDGRRPAPVLPEKQTVHPAAKKNRTRKKP